MTADISVINSFRLVVGQKYVITSKWRKKPFIIGWRYGKGEALAVIKPGTLIEMWNILKVCVKKFCYQSVLLEVLYNLKSISLWFFVVFWGDVLKYSTNLMNYALKPRIYSTGPFPQDLHGSLY